MNGSSGSFVGNIVQIEEQRIFNGAVTRHDAEIQTVARYDVESPSTPYLIPGFIDAHLYMASSMLPPAEFTRRAVRQGTPAAVFVIANVLAEAEVVFMLDSACAMPELSQMARPFRAPAVTHLAEMMNFPRLAGRGNGRRGRRRPGELRSLTNPDRLCPPARGVGVACAMVTELTEVT